jgi:NAD(P)H-dependent FMN reductase
MNILILNASPRRKGVTARALERLKAGLENHVVEWYDIHKLSIRPCTGCLKCRPEGECILKKDDGHLMAGKIRWADLIVIGSPVYWGNVPGPLKTLFDRNVTLFEKVEAGPMNRVPEPRLRGKEAITITSCGSGFPFSLLPSQAGGTIRALKTILRSGGIRIRKNLIISDSYRFEKKKDKWFKAIDRLAWKIR